MIVWIKISVVKSRPEFVLSEQADNFFVLGVLANKRKDWLKMGIGTL